MTAQMEFFAEQAAKDQVDERVLRELECNDEMVTQLQWAREVHTREQEAACEAPKGSRDNNSLSNPATVQHSVDSVRIEPSFSWQISSSIDQLLNEVRRDRAKRANTGGNFQQMFDMLKAEIRELRQKDAEWERERERWEWALEREGLLHWWEPQNNRQEEGVGSGFCKQNRAGQTQVEFQSTSLGLRGFTHSSMADTETTRTGRISFCQLLSIQI